jgi:menaquinone-dependent protoporphyrinogen oxidase
MQLPGKQGDAGMARVLVVYGSRHGGTRGIAERIGDVLRTEGLDALVTPASVASDVSSADAYVIGSGVYMGSWLDEPLDFMRRHQDALAARPTWLFSSGPIIGSSKSKADTDPVTDALGPEDGPGSGGRKKVEALSAAIHPRDHRVFPGVFDPKDPPKTFLERVVRIMPAAKNVLPTGDFRDWDAIEAWAREIATTLRSPVAVS